MNADQLVRAAYKLRPTERAKAIASAARGFIYGGDLGEAVGFGLADAKNPLDGVKAMARVTAGLVDLAQSRGVDMAMPEWVEAETDPIGLLMQLEIFANLLAEFFADGRLHTKAALSFAAIPRNMRLAAAQEWAREALAGHFRTQDDPMSDVYALQRIARTCVVDSYYSHPSQRLADWADPETDSRGALLQAASIFEALSKPEPTDSEAVQNG